jgi:integrase
LLSTSSRSGKISVQELKERMGHASLDTTQRYIHEADIVETLAANVIDNILAGTQPARRRLRVI